MSLVFRTRCILLLSFVNQVGDALFNSYVKEAGGDFCYIGYLFHSSLLDTLAAQRQLDGAQDTSDDEGSEISDADVDGDDDDEDKDDDEDLENETGGAEEEPLNSEDDVTDEDAADLFDTDNVIVCQYDKVSGRKRV